jgi:hypothetical protein
LEHGKWPIVGCEDGRCAGVLALFLKEAAGKFSKITAVGVFEAAVVIAEVMLIISI